MNDSCDDDDAFVGNVCVFWMMSSYKEREVIKEVRVTVTHLYGENSIWN